MPTVGMLPNYEAGWVAFDNGVRNDAGAVAYLSDTSDATYIANWFNTRASVSFPQLLSVLPFGSMVKTLQSYVRVYVTNELANLPASDTRAKLTAMTVTFARAEGGAHAVNTYDVGSGVGIDVYGPSLPWPPTWVDLANAPQIIIDAGAPALVFNDGSTSYAQRVAAVNVYVTYATQPTVAVLTPADGSTVTNTSRPTVSWSYTQGQDGGAQSRYQVAIYTYQQTLAPGFIAFADTRAQTPQTAPVWDSGERLGSTTSLQVGVDLPNNQQYKAWVRVAQDVNGNPHWSDPRSTANPFTVAIPPAVVPARPSLIGIPDPANARIKLTATQTTTPAWDSVTIERSSDDGATWTAVRSADHAPSVGSTFIVWDYEAGNGESVVYRAKGHLGSVISQYSPLTPALYWSSPYAWLKSPTHPELNRVVRFATAPEEKTPIKQGVFDVPGRDTAIVVSDVRKSARIDNLQFMSSSDAERLALRALFGLAEPLLLQPPDGYGFDGGYFACGDVTYKRHNRVMQSKYRIVQTSAIRVDAPVGEVVGTSLNWANVLSRYATWQSLVDTFPTWADLLGTNAAQLPPAGGETGSGGEGGTPPTPVDPTDPLLTDDSGNIIVDDSGNQIAATSTSVVVVGPTLYYRTDWSTGAGPWVARTSTPGNWNQYPVTNNSVHLYRPSQVTFAPAALGGIGVRIEAIWDGTQWYSGLIDTRYNWDFPMNRAIRITVKSRSTAARGTWPSHWTKPTPSAVGTQQNVYGDFPTKGEWDLTEFGRASLNGYGTIHMDDPFGSGTHVQYPATNNFAVDYTQWHVYTSEWDGVGTFKWYVDGVLKLTATNLPHMPKPFDQRFYPTINLAMGGDFVSTAPGPGNPVPTSSGGTTPTSSNYFDTEYFEVYLL